MEAAQRTPALKDISAVERFGKPAVLRGLPYLLDETAFFALHAFLLSCLQHAGVAFRGRTPELKDPSHVSTEYSPPSHLFTEDSEATKNGKQLDYTPCRSDREYAYTEIPNLPSRS